MSKYKILIKDNTGKVYATLLPEKGSSKHVALYEAKMLFLDGFISSDYTAIIRDSENFILYTIRSSDKGILTVIPKVII